MKEHPILFSGPMVRAILEGRKTQTRRVIIPQPNYEGLAVSEISPLLEGIDCHKTGEFMIHHPEYRRVVRSGLWCPYGKPGDRLWVRETHILRNGGLSVLYKADYDPVEASGLGGMYGGWKPSIFMPRRFSRLTLEITDVRVQRLQEISEEDARAEGISIFGATPAAILSALIATMGPITRRNFLKSATAIAFGLVDVLAGRRQVTNREAYAILWDSINAKRAKGIYAWERNPWVWAVSFRKVDSLRRAS